jgi:nicotinate-nucleotide--dimethylbenzimidazole phosphoribosyltransferase
MTGERINGEQTNETLLRRTIAEVGVLDAAAMAAARERQANLTKPPGALGRLEELSVQLAGITGVLRPSLSPRQVIVCAGDHGVTVEGVSAYPSEVTAQMVLNFLHGGAAINVLARQFGATVQVLDAGVAADLPAHPLLCAAKVRRGTANLRREPAMSRDEAAAAIAAGIVAAQQAIAGGACVLATGDMGIGNTTASAAIAAVLTGKPPAEVTGLGTGLDSVQWRHKVTVIEEALARHAPDPSDALDVLAKVGGLEIGAIGGVILAGAAACVPVIVDGIISTAGAAIAVGLCPAVQPFLIAGHRSVEPGHATLLQHLGLRPLIDLDLRLGEGTGAVLALPLLDAAVATLNDMATFAEAQVSGRES